MSKYRDRRQPCRFCGRPKPRGRGRTTCGKCGENTIIPPAVEAEVMRLYQQENLSVDAIGDMLCWSGSTIRRLLIIRGVERKRKRPVRTERQRRRDLTQDDLDRTAELYMAGLTPTEVGKIVGRSESSVKRRLINAGVPLRTKSEAHTLAHVARIAREAAALTERQAFALRMLETHGPATTGDIAARTGAPPQSTLRYMHKLAEFGLVSGRRGETGLGRPIMWKRTGLPLTGVLDAALRPTVVQGYRLPIGPFRDWLNDWIGREERKARFNAVPTKSGGDPSSNLPIEIVIADELGCDPRRLYAYLHVQDTIGIDSADRLLTHADRGVTIFDLWPHLDDERDLGEAA